VSGDFFDYIPISGSNWGMVIADVSGKGVPASLIMASFRAALWAEVHNTYSLSEICGRVNNFLYQSLGETEFVTAVYGVLNLENRLFTYSNAGHLPPIHLKSTGEVAQLEEGGLILGAFPDAVYQESWIRLSPGDLLLFHTDGSVEAQDGTGEEFGLERLIECLRQVRHLPARQIRTELVEAVRRFAGRVQLADDLTFIVLKSL
jgi:sigma-B regulation protein RsbU (phosphoserine phosphatase)